MVVFTKHAEEKFAILKRHRFPVKREQVLRALEKPDCIDRSRLPLLIAQIAIDDAHVLRVVYKQEGTAKKVITFYPGRSTQYGSE